MEDNRKFYCQNCGHEEVRDVSSFCDEESKAGNLDCRCGFYSLEDQGAV